jgi:hypothetical protein
VRGEGKTNQARGVRRKGSNEGREKGEAIGDAGEAMGARPYASRSGALPLSPALGSSPGQALPPRRRGGCPDYLIMVIPVGPTPDS